MFPLARGSLKVVCAVSELFLTKTFGVPDLAGRTKAILTSVAVEIATGLALKARVGVVPNPLSSSVIVMPPAVGSLEGPIEVIQGAATATAANSRVAAAMQNEFIMAMLGQWLENDFWVAGLMHFAGSVCQGSGRFQASLKLLTIQVMKLVGFPVKTNLMESFRFSPCLRTVEM